MGIHFVMLKGFFLNVSWCSDRKRKPVGIKEILNEDIIRVVGKSDNTMCVQKMFQYHALQVEYFSVHPLVKLEFAYLKIKNDNRVEL